MKLISESYRAMNERMHETMPHYGANGSKWGPYVLAVMKRYDIDSVVDYGAGKGSLKEWLRRYSPARVANYDPCVAEYSTLPEPAGLVTCTDVMEHVEPEHTESVLGAICGLVEKVVFFNISTRPAVKVLPDGRNAHINLQSPVQWFALVGKFFDVVVYEVQPGHSVSIVALPKDRHHG